MGKRFDCVDKIDRKRRSAGKKSKKDLIDGEFKGLKNIDLSDAKEMFSDDFCEDEEVY